MGIQKLIARIIYLMFVIHIAHIANATPKMYGNLSNLYVGFGIYNATMKDAPLNLNYKESVAKVFIGKRLANNILIEAQFMNFDDAIVEDTKAHTSSIGVSALYYILNKEKLKPFVKLGAHRWKYKSYNKDTTIKDNGADLFGGIGVDMELKDFTIRGEYSAYKFNFSGKPNAVMKVLGVSGIVGF